MTEPVIEQLKTDDLECEHILGCLYGLKDLDQKCYEYIIQNGGVSNQELSNEFDRDESTTHRAVSRLLDYGLIKETKVTYDSGGYKNVYKPKDPEHVSERMHELIENWSQMSTALVEEFEDKFGEYHEKSTE